MRWSAVAGLFLAAFWWIGPDHNFSGPVVLTFGRGHGLHLADIVGLAPVVAAVAVARRWRPAGPRLAAAGIVVVAAWMALATFTLFVAPPVSHAGHVDAVIVLPGDGARLAGPAGALARNGYAPVLVIPRPRDAHDPVDQLCEGDRGFTVICPDAASPSVRDRVRAAADTIRRFRWRQVALLTARPHSTVTKQQLNRCVHTAIAVIGKPAHQAFPRVAATEWARLLESTLWSRRC